MEAVERADEADDADEVRATIAKAKKYDGSITAHFARKTGVVTYSHRAHTKAETRLVLYICDLADQLTLVGISAEFVRWCAEDLRPFALAGDRGFQSLMKTGRPGCYIPSETTISRDTKAAFGRARTKIAGMLRNYEGKISFATDTWTSPNHRAFVAVTAHLEHNGEPLCFLLDLVKVAKVRTSSLFPEHVGVMFIGRASSPTPALIWRLHSRRS